MCNYVLLGLLASSPQNLLRSPHQITIFAHPFSLPLFLDFFGTNRASQPPSTQLFFRLATCSARCVAPRFCETFCTGVFFQHSLLQLPSSPDPPDTFHLVPPSFLLSSLILDFKIIYLICIYRLLPLHSACPIPL